MAMWEVYPIDKPTSRLVLDIQTFISFQPSVSAEAPVFPELRSYARVALWRQVVTEHDGFEPFHWNMNPLNDLKAQVQGVLEAIPPPQEKNTNKLCQS